MNSLYTTSRKTRYVTYAMAATLALAVPGFGYTDPNANTTTVSLSGSTAMKAFTGQSSGFTTVNSGSQLTIMMPGTTNTALSLPASSGLWGSVPLYLFNAGDKNYANNIGTGTNGGGVNTPSYAYIKQEWHEQGSIEGILEMVNDQIGTVATVTATNRNPANSNLAGNAVWINTNQFDGAVGTGAGSTLNGWKLGEFYATPGATSGVAAFTNVATTNGGVTRYVGVNPNGGQNAVQMAISDVAPQQGFARTGSASLFNTASSNGYGQGNPALQAVAGNNVALGVAGARVSFNSPTALTMATTSVDPRSGTGANFSTGAWNTNTLDNLDSRAVAVTGTIFAANPGTGLERLNRTDAQWLQTTGRLQNGADFNMTTRDVNSGTRNVAALSTGIDPTFASGENDGAAGVVAEGYIGGGTGVAGTSTAMKFSNKTAGGKELRPTVQNNRMAVGTISIGDAVGSSNDANATPIRGLDYADKTAAELGAANTISNAAFVRPSAGSINNGTYVIYQAEQYVTVKAPDAAYGTSNPNIQGDDAFNTVKNLRDNVLASVGQQYSATYSTYSPAGSLVNNGFMLTDMVQFQKSLSAPGQGTANPNYSTSDWNAYLAAGLASKFAIGSSPAEYAGSGAAATGAAGFAPSRLTTPVTTTAKYGQGVWQVNTTTGALVTANNPGGDIIITDPDAGNPSETFIHTRGNWFFGNFNQNGIRDLSTLPTMKTALSALITTVGADKLSWLDSTKKNNTVVSTGVPALDTMTNQAGGTGVTKGDMIAMGDFNGDGQFDGKDLLLFARGATLTDSSAAVTAADITIRATNTQLTAASGTTFGDRVRAGYLHKNAALDWLNANVGTTGADATIRTTASANPTNDPTGALAFNKFDVNSDGRLNLDDFFVVEKFYGKSYTNLMDQNSATLNVDGTTKPTVSVQPYNIVNAELLDQTTVGAGSLTAVYTSGTFNGTTTLTNTALDTVTLGGSNFNLGGKAYYKAGTSTLVVTASQAHAAGSSIVVLNGTLRLAADMGHNYTLASALSGADAAGNNTTGLTVIQATQHVAAVNVTAGSVQMDPAGGRKVLVTDALSLGSASTFSGGTVWGGLDLTNNDLLLKGGAGNLAAVKGLFTNANKQLKTSANLVGGYDLATLAILTGTDYHAVRGVTAKLDGEDVANNDVVVKYAYAGDADLDGIISADDYLAIDAGYLMGHASGWINGDFNNDGTISAADYMLIDRAALHQGSPLAGAMMALHAAAWSDSGYELSAVPEPTSVALLAVGAAALLSRRKR